MTRLILCLFLQLVLINGLKAQRNVRDSTLSFVSIAPHIGFQYPFADMSSRFGYGGITGVELIYKSKSNWTIEAKYDFLFGNRVEEDTILNPLKTKADFVINSDGEPAVIYLYERGFMAGVKVGKIFPIGKANVNSGIHVATGVGLMQHKIKILETDEKVPQLHGEYLKGYDRLSNGLMLNQSIGYSHFSDYKLINYYVGIEFYEGFTQNRRSVNLDTGKHDGTQRFDVVGSVVFRWYFPIYKRQAQDFYFY